jgi:hypothetical protein
VWGSELPKTNYNSVLVANNAKQMNLRIPLENMNYLGQFFQVKKKNNKKSIVTNCFVLWSVILTISQINHKLLAYCGCKSKSNF